MSGYSQDKSEAIRVQCPRNGTKQTADVLITVSGDDTYMTVYNPTEEVLELIGSLAGSEGLFILSYDDFLEHVITLTAATHYGFTVDDLKEREGLKEFFGFTG